MEDAADSGTTPLSPRRHFLLRTHEREHLDASGWFWETVKEADTQWLIIDKYEIPDGYLDANNAQVQLVRIALRIPLSYPGDQIDMVYINPPLSLKNNRQINNLSPLSIDGKVFQQWSRHRTQANPWRDEDGVDTHLQLVNHWLHIETTK